MRLRLWRVSVAITRVPTIPLSRERHHAAVHDRSSLSSQIDALSAGGSTAGHIGLAWGWYLLSPNFSSILPAESQPADYEEPDVLKVVILMTDGSIIPRTAMA